MTNRPQEPECVWAVMGCFCRLGTQLQILEDRYASRSQENASKPYRTMEERMAVYRREVDERSKQEVAQQVWLQI